jgi:hypothetical protein
LPSIYFSEFLDVAPATLENYGAFDVSLVSDLPLFVDPFLLFNSDDPEYQALHEEILRYMRFLKKVTLEGGLATALVNSWFSFPEVKQNWLGFSKTGNSGRGLGKEFAQALHHNFQFLFPDFGEETVTQGSHLEKLCLVRNGVGRDMISDFTTNLIKAFLGRYSQRFAETYLRPDQRRRVALQKSKFNYDTRSWSPMYFELPFIQGDFVLLTPKDILTKDDAWINRPELIDRFIDIADSLPNEVLRLQLSDYLERVLPGDHDKTKEEVREAIAVAIEKFPQVLDYYIKDKEARGDEATATSQAKVSFVQTQFVEHVREFVNKHLEPGGFYRTRGNTHKEAMERLLFLKDVIENKGGHRIFFVDGKPIEREADLQILYRLTWYATPSDLTREANDGRGPVDFKVSRGAPDKTLVEFKLAKNTQLERNLAKQTETYEKASDPTNPSLKAILYFSEEQFFRVQRILEKLEMSRDPNIVLIDASADNKPSGSKA